MRSDPRLTAILLIVGDKTDDDRFVPLPNRLYDEHLNVLEEQGAI